MRCKILHLKRKPIHLWALELHLIHLVQIIISAPKDPRLNITCFPVYYVKCASMTFIASSQLFNMLDIWKIFFFKSPIRFSQIAKSRSKPLALETNLGRLKWIAVSTGVSFISVPDSSQAILLKVPDACQSAYCGCKDVSADAELIAQSNWRQRLWRCYRRSSVQRLQPSSADLNVTSVYRRSETVMEDWNLSWC